MSRPTRCQIPSGHCEIPPAYKLTLQSAGGLIWIEASCRSHANPRTDQVVAAGGRFVAVEELPSLSAPVLPDPVGLDDDAMEDGSHGHD